MTKELQARNYAFLLLKIRPRSEKELHERLKKKGFDPQTVKEVLTYLKSKGFVNDAQFARIWTESRLQKSMGLRRIKTELGQKGIEKEIIAGEIEGIKQNYREDEIISELVERRMEKLAGLDPQKAKARVVGYLARRGFSYDAILDAVSKIK